MVKFGLFLIIQVFIIKATATGRQSASPKIAVTLSAIYNHGIADTARMQRAAQTIKHYSRGLFTSPHSISKAESAVLEAGAAMPRKRTTRTQADGATATAARTTTALPKGLEVSDLVDYYTRMVQVRSLDERIWALNRQGKVPIAASCQGHEAAQLGSLLAAEKDGDCFLFPYYRDLALKMAIGLTPTQVMLSFMGKAGDPYSNCRQFPLQGADIPHNIIQISNVGSARLIQATGDAIGCKMIGDATVTVTYFGEVRSRQ